VEVRFSQILSPGSSLNCIFLPGPTRRGRWDEPVSVYFKF
jgi:hypothetical protein